MSLVSLKSDKDLEALRASADLVSRTLAEVAKHVRPGVTTLDLDEIAETYVRDHGAEPAFKGYKVGRAVFPATLCTSINEVVVHGIPDNAPLEEGQILTADCGVVLDGFYGDSAYTFAVGEISDELAGLCAATYDSLLAGIKSAVAGGRVGDISSAVQQHCERLGYGVVRDLVGHGIGRSLHEAPQVPNFGRRGVGRKLKHGMTMCIEPMITLGAPDVSTDEDMWTIRTVDGRAAAHYEHMVAVLRGGAEVLTTFEHIEKVVTPPYRQPVEQNG